MVAPRASAPSTARIEPRTRGRSASCIVAFLYFAAISIVLTLIDLDTHRLPNSIVLPSYLVAGVLFTSRRC